MYFYWTNNEFVNCMLVLYYKIFSSCSIATKLFFFSSIVKKRILMVIANFKVVFLLSAMMRK